MVDDGTQFFLPLFYDSISNKLVECGWWMISCVIDTHTFSSSDKLVRVSSGFGIVLTTVRIIIGNLLLSSQLPTT